MTECDPITPGEILLEEFLKPMGLSQYRLAAWAQPDSSVQAPARDVRR